MTLLVVKARPLIILVVQETMNKVIAQCYTQLYIHSPSHTHTN